MAGGVVLIGSSLNVLKHFKSCIANGDGTFSTLKLFYCRLTALTNRFAFVFHGFHVKSNILKPFLHENYFLKGIKTTVCVENLIESKTIKTSQFLFFI